MFPARDVHARIQRQQGAGKERQTQRSQFSHCTGACHSGSKRVIKLGWQEHEPSSGFCSAPSLRIDFDIWPRTAAFHASKGPAACNRSSPGFHFGLHVQGFDATFAYAHLIFCFTVLHQSSIMLFLSALGRTHYTRLKLAACDLFLPLSHCGTLAPIFSLSDSRLDD